MNAPVSSATRRRAYWRANVGIVAALLGVWAVVSFGLSVVFVDALNEVRLGGFRLGFWMAQQGSMYVFVALIFAYVWLMNRLDRAYGLDERHAAQDETERSGAQETGAPR